MSCESRTKGEYRDSMIGFWDADGTTIGVGIEGMKGGIITIWCVDVEVEDEMGVVKMGVVIRGAVGIKGISRGIETTRNSRGT